MELWFTGLKLHIQLYLVNPKPLGREKGLLERGRKKKVPGTLKCKEILALSLFKIFDVRALAFQKAG